MKRLLAAGALLVVATAASAAPSPQGELMAADRAFSKLSVAKGQDYAFLAFMAGNGRLFGAGDEKPIYGRAQAFRRLTRGRGRGSLSWEPEIATVSADGKMGWTDGHWRFMAPGSKRPATGHYLTVWAKDRRGGWKVQADMGTTDPLPPKAVKK